MPKALAADRISRLNGERIQRPEAPFCSSEHGPPADPSQADDQHKQKERPDPAVRRYDLFRKRCEPSGGDQRSKPEQDARQHNQDQPGNRQLGQTDLRQETAGDCKERAPLCAGRIILDIATARIDKRGHQRCTSDGRNMETLIVPLCSRGSCLDRDARHGQSSGVGDSWKRVKLHAGDQGRSVRSRIYGHRVRSRGCPGPQLRERPPPVAAARREPCTIATA